MEHGAWPIAINATQDVACGVRLWSTAGKRRATVVVKATFYLVRGAPMRLVNPAPILLGDQHHDSNVERSVAVPSDMSPYLPRGEVILSGHAHAPVPSTFLATRLCVMGSRTLVDKTLHVFGERMWLEGDQVTQPVPFTRIPLRYERASQGNAGFDENPVGMPKGAGLPAANVVDPHDADTAAGFGPIASRWMTRRRLLRGLDLAAIEQLEPVFPDTFAWSFFHVAPPDQRCSFFEGAEWIVLEGIHPEFPRFESQLPAAIGRARVYSATRADFEQVSLVADTIFVDCDRSLCCVTWRGNFEIDAATDLASLQIFAGLEMPGRPVPWPAPPGADDAPPATQLPIESTFAGEPLPVIVAAIPEPLPITEGTLPMTEERRPPRQASLLAGLQEKSNLNQTLASPGTLAQNLIAETVVRGRAQTSSGMAVRPPESVTSIRVDPAWLDDAERRALAAAEAAKQAVGPDSESLLSSTVTQAPSELRKLLASNPTSSQPSPAPFDDPPTIAPTTDQIAELVRAAEEDAPPSTRALDRAPPVGTRPEPIGTRPQPVALRALRTTIRGLGTNARDSSVPTSPPDQLGALEESSPLQGGDGPTVQHAVPDLLLKIAAGQGPPSAAPTFEPAPQPGDGRAWPTPESLAAVFGPSTVQRPAVVIDEPSDFDEDDAGRPTLTGMEAPPVSALAPPPQVHRGETRMEIERRMREGEPLEGLDLSSLDLAGFDFSGKSLVGCKLDRATLTKCRFVGTNLTGASFRGADLSGGTLDTATLERASFAAAKLDGCSFRGAFVSDASFAGAEGRGAVFEACTGQRSSFARCELIEANFVGVQLDSADFTEAALEGARLEGSLLPDLQADELSARGAVFNRASLQNARFAKAVLEGAQFDAIAADDSVWERAQLAHASFAGAHLSGANFARAALDGANLRGAVLDEARFAKASLSGANLVGVDVAALTLDGADLTGAITNE